MSHGFLKQRFEPRAYPEAIFIAPDGDVLCEGTFVGPFCLHCGNPLSYHGGRSGRQCPNVHLHPLFPPPRLPFKQAS